MGNDDKPTSKFKSGPLKKGALNALFLKYPFLRGVVAYSITWPSANLAQQTFQRKPLDYWQAIRYGLVGVTFVLPVYYTWLRNINRFMPGSHWKTIAKKVVLEQSCYWPIAITVFFAGMNFYERQSFAHFKEELKEKYVKTHTTSMCYWPFVGTIINYSSFIKDHNRAPCAAVASFIWASFLSYVKSLELKNNPPPKQK